MSANAVANGITTSDSQISAALLALQNSVTNLIFNTGGLAIKAGGSALAKTVNTVHFRIGDKVYSKAAADCAALSGTVTKAKFNIYAFYVDASGTMTSAMGTEGATLAAVVLPTAVPASTACLGYVIINPTGTGNFVGGTTALDDATVAPNAVYVNTVGVSIFPNVSSL